MATNDQHTRRLGEIAHLVSGQLTGDAYLQVLGAAPLNEVQAGQISFIDDAKRAAQAAESPALAFIAPQGVECGDKPVIHVNDVHAAFAAVVEAYCPRRESQPAEISPAAIVSPTAQIDTGVTIGPGATVGEQVTIAAGTIVHAGVHIMAGCQIGRGVTLYPGAVLYEDTIVGDRSIVHANAVLGAYGFGYRQAGGRHVATSQLGNVVIGSDVEVGANTAIDRGTYSSTRVGEGTKIDNLVQIAHNCQIGKHNLLCSQVGIAGSTSTGDYVVMAGQVGVRDHVHIGEGATIGAMSGVSNDIAPGVSAFGAPAIPERDKKIQLASLAKLPEMRKEFKKVRKVVAELQASQDQNAADDGLKAIDPAA